MVEVGGSNPPGPTKYIKVIDFFEIAPATVDQNVDAQFRVLIY